MEFIEHISVGFWKKFDSILQNKETTRNELFYALAALQHDILQCYRKIIDHVDNPSQVLDLRDETSALLSQIIRCHRAKGVQFQLYYDTPKPWSKPSHKKLIDFSMAISLIQMSHKRIDNKPGNEFVASQIVGGMETKLRETKLKLENSGEMRHTLVLWNQIISAIFRVQAWETKLK
jgi:hypothetical protein